MGMEDLSIDITYDPCYFSLDSTFNQPDSEVSNYLIFGPIIKHLKIQN
jgi:hypothetical protein